MTTTNETIAQLKTEGFCVLPDVIPAAELPALHAAVLEQERAQRAEWAAMVARFADAGQQLPPSGVGHAQALINYVPELSRYAADPRIIGPAEGILGRFVRVSSVSGLVNFPGNARGYWHADWPFNQSLATCVPAPYADVALQLSGIFMISAFSPESGGTLIVPRSHRAPNNPTAYEGVDRAAPHEAELQVSGTAGSLLLYDSRLWHAVATNRSRAPRVAVTIRYAPWWLNLEVRRKGTADFQRIAAHSSGKDNSVPLIPRPVFEKFHEEAKPLFMHWIEP